MAAMRRYLRFGLGTLFIVVTLICVVLGTNVWRVLPQRRAVAALNQLGVTVVYDRHQGEHWLQLLVARRLGMDWSYGVREVSINADTYNDGIATHLTRLPGLRKLHLWAYGKPDGTPSGLTDEGLRIIATIPTLEHVSLRGHKITDAGLDYLRKHPRIKEVQVVPYH
jgi:hypothetical protein